MIVCLYYIRCYDTVVTMNINLTCEIIYYGFIIPVYTVVMMQCAITVKIRDILGVTVNCFVYILGCNDSILL